MGQKDPLVEWQREGFDMFGQMMHGIWQDFVRYVMHVDVKVNRPVAATGTAAAPEGAAATPTDAAPAGAAPLGGDGDGAGLSDLQYSSPDDPVRSGGAAGLAAAARAEAAATGGAPAGGDGRAATATATAPETNTPIVKSDWDKTPRNAPCPCGSGKKYKQCHGR